MIDVDFELPSQVDKLANFVVQKIQRAHTRILYVSFLFANRNIWTALRQKIQEGIEVTVFAPPITSYSGNGVPRAYEIYSEATDLSSARNNFHFYSCPLWWQKDRSLNYLQSFINVPYTLHAKLLVVDNYTYLPSSNFESAKHYDLCIYHQTSLIYQKNATISQKTWKSFPLTWHSHDITIWKTWFMTRQL